MEAAAILQGIAKWLADMRFANNLFDLILHSLEEIAVLFLATGKKMFKFSGIDNPGNFFRAVLINAINS